MGAPRLLAIAAAVCFVIALAQDLTEASGGDLIAWTLGGLLALAIRAAL